MTAHTSVQFHSAVWTFFIALYAQALTFDFLILEKKTNATNGDKICKSRGYDGLAVVNTPESFAYLLRITEEKRISAGKGVNIGLYLKVDTMEFRWYDGNLPAPDLPWLYQDTQPDVKKPYGRIHHSGRINMESGKNWVHTACSNYTSTDALAVAYGTTFRDQEPLYASVHQTRSYVTSYLECVLLCSANYRCRVAAFYATSLECRTLGVETTTMIFQPKSEVTTFDSSL
ncbi:hypothetical protein RRG08_016518 [Elysia crispata]|uniref:Apple domain-containing protein n=1 Tax=Elysia crispata TaxID=231223 RepID=A0AAE1E2Y6_9GAST|nr:hypothetical protein RRG08_016518 [Elysia crispata]